MSVEKRGKKEKRFTIAVGVPRSRSDTVLRKVVRRTEKVFCG